MSCRSTYNNTIRWADPENRKKQSERLKEANKNPELNKKHKEAAKKRWEDPEYRTKTTEAARIAHQTPEYCAYMSKINKERCADPEVKARMSERQKKLWQDPKFRQKTTEAIIEAHATEEYQAKIQAFWTEEKRAIASEQTKAVAAERDMGAVAKIRWDKPGARTKHSEIIKSYWEDPVKGLEWARAQRRRPTKPELALFSFLGHNDYANYVYTGDGSFLIGRKNPDFICFETKSIIEMFGAYWHEKSEVGPRADYFANYGFQTLVIWDYELDNEKQLILKLDEFHQGIKFTE